ncbi:hypothetical protein BD310DRAFT_907807 [Dichomitus squalens]|uniref:Uncharacterized protein n=1 Tax=Dichomitus squalens TaxID=114155 RepID=A0A4Q9PPS5_9APHY|nr:hypothetical protein BD310DRAFT_907807 [Dichomitus squalens]
MTVPDNETSGAEIQGPRGWRGLRIGKRSRSFSSPTTLSDPGAVLGYIVCKIFAVEGALEKHGWEICRAVTLKDVRNVCRRERAHSRIRIMLKHSFIPDLLDSGQTLCYNSRDSPWWEYRVTVNIPAEILNKIDMFGLVVAHCAITWGRSCLQCYAPNQPLDLWSSASDSLNILSQMACLWGDKDRCKCLFTYPTPRRRHLLCPYALGWEAVEVVMSAEQQLK